MQFFSDDKEFGVYLAYHFSQDLDKFAQSDVKQLIPWISELLKTMGYKVYDKTMDFKTEGKHFEKFTLHS